MKIDVRGKDGKEILKNNRTDSKIPKCKFTDKKTADYNNPDYKNTHTVMFWTRHFQNVHYISTPKNNLEFKNTVNTDNRDTGSMYVYLYLKTSMKS